MNPPFGGKEAQTDFDYETGATVVLFLQHVLESVKRAAAVASSWTKADSSAIIYPPERRPSPNRFYG